MFLRSGGLGTGFFRRLVPDTTGSVEVDFTANNERGAYYLQGSTNFADWHWAPREEDGLLALWTNKITRCVDPFPGYAGARFYRAVNPLDVCISNLMVINHVKALWALETGKTATATPTDNDLFGPGRYLPTKPACPKDGIYYLNDFGTPPTCSQSTSGHSL